ncbi:MAG: sulfotransferase [Gomphosphaeria aponina SAG 52.96 = DSM 107014]|uniref:Sulfotransferase n=1 Tax=Gomphosphaeria aponina SAG 52.96 = DSM 107014 TaxID=1521640 RepID=A0A941GVF5_9CHRO|nr:sulfotransferase [Gomphosphaeria aponina SAG 52.96 = DSM 107014]
MEEKLKQPITLISHGRSGTSLLQNIFEAHPDISVAGETADLIFSTWYSIERAKGIIPGLIENGKVVAWEERVGRGVRAVFDEIFNLNTTYWMQKPIGQPFVINYLRKEGMSLDEWFQLYWSILNQVFPAGKFMTILRHPCDVVISAGDYWGRKQADVWGGIATMARCILHRDSKVKFAVNYTELVKEPEKNTKKMFEQLGIGYDSRVLRAFDYVYVPNQKGWKQDKKLYEGKIEKQFSREDEWEKLDFSLVKKEDIEVIEKLWARFGYNLELPGKGKMGK